MPDEQQSTFDEDQRPDRVRVYFSMIVVLTGAGLLIGVVGTIVGLAIAAHLFPSNVCKPVPTIQQVTVS